jgi:hypothetical protein
VHLRILHPGNLRPASAPQKICQTALVGHSVPLVQIRVQRVQISVPQVQLHPRMSRPPSDVAHKCDTARLYIFEYVNNFKKNINPMRLYLGLSISIQQNHLQSSPILWDYPFKSAKNRYWSCLFFSLWMNKKIFPNSVSKLWSMWMNLKEPLLGILGWHYSSLSGNNNHKKNTICHGSMNEFAPCKD